MKKTGEFPYEDIIDLPHPVSGRRIPMPMLNRAAQFAPFAALTGYDAAIEETARLTDAEITLSESEVVVLNEKLQALSQRLPEHPQVTVTYFRQDERKTGGAYMKVTGPLKKIDPQTQSLILDSGETILLDRLISLESDILE